MPRGRRRCAAASCGDAGSARELIRDAYGFRNRAQSEIVGAPDWTDKERHDVEAKTSVDFSW